MIRIEASTEEIEAYVKAHDWMCLLNYEGLAFVSSEFKKYEMLNVPAPINYMKHKCDRYKLWKK